MKFLKFEPGTILSKKFLMLLKRSYVRNSTGGEKNLNFSNLNHSEMRGQLTHVHMSI